MKGRFPSGQRGQTVNLLATPSKVRILLSPPGLYAWVAQWQSVSLVRKRSAVQSCFQAPFAIRSLRLPFNLQVIFMRDIIHLQCTECKEKNYTTTRNKKTKPAKLEVKKFCNRDRKHTLHKEAK